MKYIITKDKLEQVILHFLNKGYGDLTEHKNKKHPKSIFYMKNNKIYMEWDKKYGANHGVLWVDSDTIYYDLKMWFSLEKNDIESIIKKWVEETYNIKGITPYFLIGGNITRWRRYWA